MGAFCLYVVLLSLFMAACSVVPGARPAAPLPDTTDKAAQAKIGELLVETSSALALADRTATALQSVVMPADAKFTATPYAILADLFEQAGIGTIAKNGSQFSYRSDDRAVPGSHIIATGRMRGAGAADIETLGVELDAKDSTAAPRDFIVFTAEKNLATKTYSIDFSALSELAAAVNESSGVTSPVLGGVLDISVGPDGSELVGNSMTYKDSLVEVSVANFDVIGAASSPELKTLKLHAEIKSITPHGLSGSVDVYTSGSNRSQLFSIFKANFSPSVNELNSLELPSAATTPSLGQPQEAQDQINAEGA